MVGSLALSRNISPRYPAEALTESFKSKYPTDEARSSTVEWLMQNACNGIIHGPASSGGRGMGAHMQAAACHDPDFRNCDSEYKKIH